MWPWIAFIHSVRGVPDSSNCGTYAPLKKTFPELAWWPFLCVFLTLQQNSPSRSNAQRSQLSQNSSKAALRGSSKVFQRSVVYVPRKRLACAPFFSRFSVVRV